MSGVSWETEAWVDLGHDTEMTRMTDTDTGELLGIVERHPCADAVLTGHSVPFVDGPGPWPPSPRWTVEQADPLTLSPSLQCPSCPHHGWIRDGRWIPA